MLFNSYNFLFFFLPIFFSLIILSFNFFNKKKIFILVILFSLIFYSFDNFNFTFLLFLSIILNYFFSIKIDKTNNYKFKKTFLVLIIIINLFVLGYFKYYNFFIENLNYFKIYNFDLINTGLPLAISFFTFQQISFQIDNFKLRVNKSFTTYFLYVCFFPQLIAGPIIRYSHFIKETFKNNFLKINSKNLSIGLSIILIGVFKKVIFADTASLYVDNYLIRFGGGYDVAGIDALLFIIFFSIQIYFDFSAYCDIAVGIAKILNFDIPINFDSPYKSRSIIDFWKKWHITLSQFFRDYLYIVLGGNKNSFFVKLILIIFVMSVCGFWHGASNNFIVWGFIHGVLISINHLLIKLNFTTIKKIPYYIRIIFTFLLVSLAFVFFRVTNIYEAFQIISYAFNFSDYLNNSFFIKEISNFNKLIMFSSVLVVFFAPNIFQIFDLKLVNINKIDKNDFIKFKSNISWLVFILVLLLFIIFNLGSPSTFIYFHF
jgi:alginate O-acetyltransferase complex protein AlgI